MKRIAKIALFLIIIAALYAPCLAQTEREKTITLSIWGIPEYDQYRGTHEAIREFQRRHPDIKIQVGAPGGSANRSAFTPSGSERGS